MTKLKGRARYEDDEDPEAIHHVTTDIESTPETGRVVVGDRHGVLGRFGVVEATTHGARHFIGEMTRAIQATSYRNSPPRTVPKPPSDARAAETDVPEGLCRRCSGEGEYLWGDVTMVTCPDCDGTGRTDRGLTPDEEG